MKPVDHKARSHSDLPPSSADKWLHCHAWRRLRAEFVAEFGEPPSSAAADEGTEAHELMERHLRGQLLPETYHGFHELMEAIEWVEAQPGELHLEAPVDFGELFGYVGLTGTVDIILVEDNRLTIADLKFGRGVVEHKRNPQMMVYLAGAVAKFGERENYRLAVLQPRAYHPEGNNRVFELTHEELEDFIYNELEPAIERSYHPRSRAIPGPHCRNFCPMAPTCKALRDQGRARLRLTPIERLRDG